MNEPTTARRMRPIVVVAVAVALVFAVAAWRPWSAAPAAPVASGEEITAVIAPEPLMVPEGARVLIFGDSWTYGSAATVPELGYAYVIGASMAWQGTVDGVRGSGYLRPGIDGPAFGERIAALDPALDPDLVIIQGSINDRLLILDGVDAYRAAVNAAWDALAGIYPEASIVVLGPAPHILPIGEGTAAIDTELGALAGARGWWYISPIGEDWITDAQYLDLIDTGAGRNHPSPAGHLYLADRLAQDLAGLAATTDAAIEVPEPALPLGD